MRIPRLMRRDIVLVCGRAFELFSMGKSGKMLYDHTEYPKNERNLCYAYGMFANPVERDLVERVWRLDENGDYRLICRKEDKR